MYTLIKALCAARGISIGELERQAELKPRTVFHWGQTMPSADKLARAAKVLGVTVDELLNEQKEAI